MKKRRCSVYGKSLATPVAYGFPSAELLQEAERGEVILGGCVIEAGQPRSLCDRCASNPSSDPDRSEETS